MNGRQVVVEEKRSTSRGKSGFIVLYLFSSLLLLKSFIVYPSKLCVFDYVYDLVIIYAFEFCTIILYLETICYILERRGLTRAKRENPHLIFVHSLYEAMFNPHPYYIGFSSNCSRKKRTHFGLNRDLSISVIRCNFQN